MMGALVGAAKRGLEIDAWLGVARFSGARILSLLVEMTLDSGDRLRYMFSDEIGC
jgi:hypothetical protein